VEPNGPLRDYGHVSSSGAGFPPGPLRIYLPQPWKE